MNIQEYLRNGNSIDDLCSRFMINMKRHKLYPNLVMLKYKFDCADFNNVYVQEARGLILDADDNWNIVCYPYNKFFNVGDKLAANINLAKDEYRLYDKSDGRLMILYYYHKKSEWIVASSGLPDASGTIGKDSETTLADKFWEVFAKLNYNLPTNVNNCYMFELILSQHPIVISYTDDTLILHGARNLITYQELDPLIEAQQCGYRAIGVIFESDANITIDDLKTMTDQLNGHNYEGYVLCDSNFNRVKLKAKSYVTIQYTMKGIINVMIHGKVNVRKILPYIYNINDKTELIIYMPNLREPIKRVEAVIDNLGNEIIDIYNSIRDCVDDRDFSSSANKYWYSRILHQIRILKKKNINHDVTRAEIDNIFCTLIKTNNNQFIMNIDKLVNKGQDDELSYDNICQIIQNIYQNPDTQDTQVVEKNVELVIIALDKLKQEIIEIYNSVATIGDFNSDIKKLWCYKFLVALKKYDKRHKPATITIKIVDEIITNNIRNLPRQFVREIQSRLKAS